MNRRHVYSTFVLVLLLLASLGVLTGCGKAKLSEKQIADYIPPEIQSYTLGDETVYSEVKEVTIDSRETDGDYDTVYCTVKLEDEYLERFEYLALDFSRYDGEWMLDGWWRTNEGYCMVKSGPSDDLCNAALEEYGYQNVTVKDEELYDETTFGRTYEVNDSYEYASFQGTLQMTATFFYYSYDNYPASADWEIEFDTSGVQPEWKNVLGTWTGTSKKKLSMQTGEHGKFEVVLNELKENDWCDISGGYWWPGVEPGTTNPIGLIKSELIEARYFYDGDCPANATLTIKPNFDNYYYGDMTFTPDKVTMNINGYWYDIARQ